MLVNEEDPLKSINENEYFKSFNHGIKKLIRSKKDTIDVNYMICECSEEENVLVLSFGVTESMQDFLVNCHFIGFKGIEGSCHAGLYHRAFQIPIKYLIEKINKQNYEIILTGHCFGASIASLVALRILTSKELSVEKKNKIFFIGFGSPEFSDQKCKEFVNENFRDNFHFYFNLNDNVPWLLNMFLDYFIRNIDNETKAEEMKKIFDIFSKLFTQKILNHTESSDTDNNSFDYYRFKTDLKEVLTIENQTAAFGRLLYFNEFNIKQMKSKSVPYSCSIKEFFNDLRKFILKNKLERINGVVFQYNEFYLPDSIIQSENFDELTENSLNQFYIEKVINVFDVHIFLKIRCQKSEYISKAQIELDDLKTFSCYGNKLFKFIIPNNVFYRTEVTTITRRVSKIARNFKIKINSHFSDTELVPKKNVVTKYGFKSKKELEIESMSLEYLYLYAVFYYKIFSTLKDSAFEERCKRLENLFKEIDNIWELKENKKHDYNQNKSKKLEIRNFLLNLCKTEEIIRDITKDAQDIAKLSFGDNYVSLEEYAKEKDFENLTFILPTCYDLMKRQSSNQASFGKHQELNVDIEIVASLGKAILFFPVTLPIALVLMPWGFGIYLASDERYMTTLFKIAVKNENLQEDMCKSLNYPGCFEEILVNWFKDPKKKKILTPNNKIYRMIMCNREIRNILKEDWIIGVVGEKKSGKSTFIEKMIDGAKANSSDTDPTLVMSPYKLSDSIVLIDYPHFDSTKFNQKLQLIFTQKLLDHTFVLCQAIQVMEVNDTEKLFKLVQSQGENFTILLNKADSIGDDKTVSFEERQKKLDKIIEQVISLRKTNDKEHYNDEFPKKIKLTCFKKFDDAEIITRIRKTNILYGDKLKENIYSILLNLIKENNGENEKIRKSMIDKIERIKKTPSSKTIEIQAYCGGKQKSRRSLLITENRKICDEKVDNDVEIYDSFNLLVQAFKTDYTFLQNPIFTEKINDDAQIESIHGFLESNESLFIVRNKI